MLRSGREPPEHRVPISGAIRPSLESLESFQCARFRQVPRRTHEVEHQPRLGPRPKNIPMHRLVVPSPQTTTNRPNADTRSLGNRRSRRMRVPICVVHKNGQTRANLLATLHREHSHSMNRHRAPELFQRVGAARVVQSLCAGRRRHLVESLGHQNEDLCRSA